MTDHSRECTTLRISSPIFILAFLQRKECVRSSKLSRRISATSNGPNPENAYPQVIQESWQHPQSGTSKEGHRRCSHWGHWCALSRHSSASPSRSQNRDPPRSLQLRFYNPQVESRRAQQQWRVCVMPDKSFVFAKRCLCKSTFSFSSDQWHDRCAVQHEDSRRYPGGLR